MWKCPACETLNDKEICVICGEPKPAGGESTYSAPPVVKEREIPAYPLEMAGTDDGLDPTPRLEYKQPESSSGSSNWGLIMVLIILGVITLLIIIGASVGYATDERLNAAYHRELSEEYTTADTYDLLTE